MTANNDAKAGRFRNGNIETDMPLHHARDRSRLRNEQSEGNRGALYNLPPKQSSIFGDGQSEAEAHLYDYLNRVNETATQQSPLDVLTARLSELTQPSRQNDIEKAATVLSHDPDQEIKDDSTEKQFQWFESQFSELKHVIANRKDDRSELDAINAKLADIVQRMDQFSAQLPAEKSITSLERQLLDLTKSLSQTRKDNLEKAANVTRAAEVVSHAAEAIKTAQRGFEQNAANMTVELKQTIQETASDAVAFTVEQITAALETISPQIDLSRVENELKELNTFSQVNGKRTLERMDKIHSALHDYLDRDPVEEVSNKSRPQIQTPVIKGEALLDSFKRDLESRFFDKPVQSPPPIAQNPRSKQDMAPPPRPKAPFNEHPVFQERQPAPPLNYAFDPAQTFDDDERIFPIKSLIAVAFALLLASAALYMLHIKKVKPTHLSDAATATKIVSAPVMTETQKPVLSDGIKSMSVDQTNDLPTLFTASDPTISPFGKKAVVSNDDVQSLTEAASRGDKVAQYKVGLRFLNATASENNITSAARWLERAAYQNYTDAQFLLASLYERGVGVVRDEQKAVELYKEASNKKHIRAMHNLAVLLSERQKPDDYREAAKWFELAANSGLRDSQYDLAILYERGLGVTPDDRKAYFWYLVASLPDDHDAKIQADRLSRMLSRSDVEAIGTQVANWRRNAINNASKNTN